jgi:hypothetical protein
MRIFKAFFSYARHDAETDPALVDAFTEELEHRVNSKLSEDRFYIWRDTEGLHVGDMWSPQIEIELRASDILVLLATPRWLGSENCRKEYEYFEKIEQGRASGSFIAPILTKDVEQELGHLPQRAREIYARIIDRQYLSLAPVAFAKLTRAKRATLVDRVADDLKGMIDRVRRIPSGSTSFTNPRSLAKRSEFGSISHDYAEVDFVSFAEIEMENRVKLVVNVACLLK